MEGRGEGVPPSADATTRPHLEGLQGVFPVGRKTTIRVGEPAVGEECGGMGEVARGEIGGFVGDGDGSLVGCVLVGLGVEVHGEGRGRVAHSFGNVRAADVGAAGRGHAGDGDGGGWVQAEGFG